METALITAIGSFSGDIVIKSLKKHGIRVLGCDIYPKEWIVDAYQVDNFFQVPKGTEGATYIETILQICAENAVQYLIPLTDVEIDTLNESREAFDALGVKICMSQHSAICACRNKMSSFSLLQGVCKNVVPIATRPGTDWEMIEKGMLPLICKPFNGRSSQGICRIYSLQELAAFFNVNDPAAYIIQPLIDGPVITVDVIRQDNTVVAVPREELLRTLNGAGTSVLVFHDDRLTADCARIANCLGIIGCVNFEFIRSSEDQYYFLECNARFSGGVEFSNMVGYDFVWNHLKCFRGEAIDELNAYRDCYIARKYEETVTAFRK